MAAKVLTAVIRVISLRMRSSKMGRIVGSCTAGWSASRVTIAPMHTIAHSFTSWSWSCACKRFSTTAYSLFTCASYANDLSGGFGRRMHTSSVHTRSASATVL